MSENTNNAPDQELQDIVNKMIADGKSEEEIAAVVQRYNEKKQQGEPGKKDESAEIAKENISKAIDDYGAGTFVRDQMVSEVRKFLPDTYVFEDGAKEGVEGSARTFGANNVTITNPNGVSRTFDFGGGRDALKTELFDFLESNATQADEKYGRGEEWIKESNEFSQKYLTGYFDEQTMANIEGSTMSLEDLTEKVKDDLGMNDWFFQEGRTEFMSLSDVDINNIVANEYDRVKRTKQSEKSNSRLSQFDANLPTSGYTLQNRNGEDVFVNNQKDYIDTYTDNVIGTFADEEQKLADLNYKYISNKGVLNEAELFSIKSDIEDQKKKVQELGEYTTYIDLKSGELINAPLTDDPFAESDQYQDVSEELSEAEKEIQSSIGQIDQAPLDLLEAAYVKNAKELSALNSKLNSESEYTYMKYDDSFATAQPLHKESSETLNYGDVLRLSKFADEGDFVTEDGSWMPLSVRKEIGWAQNRDLFDVDGRNERNSDRERLRELRLQQQVLSRAYLLNEDVTSVEKNNWNNRAKLLGEGFGFDLDDVITEKEVVDEFNNTISSAGISVTPEARDYVERSFGEQLGDDATHMVPVLAEFALANPVFKVATAAKVFKGGRSLSQILSAAKSTRYRVGANIYTEAQVTNLASKAKLTNAQWISREASRLGVTATKVGASPVTKGGAIITEGILEGAKFASLPSSEGTRGDAFVNGFGFGVMGQVLNPLMGSIKSKQFNTNTASGRWLYNNAPKLDKAYGLLVKSPASFVTGSELGETLVALSNDALDSGDWSEWNQFIDERYGDLSDVTKRYTSQYIMGVGLGFTHKATYTKRQSISELRDASREQFKEAENKAKQAEQLRSEGKKEQADALVMEALDHHEVYLGLQDQLRRSEDFLDLRDETLGTFTLERLTKEQSKFFGKEGIDVKVERAFSENQVNEKTGEVEIEGLGSRDAEVYYVDANGNRVGEPKKGDTIVVRYNVDTFDMGLAPHELGHAGMNVLFGRDARFKGQFIGQMVNIAKEVVMPDGRTLLEQMSERSDNWKKAGNESWKTSTLFEWELFSHLAQELAKPGNMAALKGSGAYRKYRDLIKNSVEPKTGHKYNLTEMVDVVEFFGDYIETINKGGSGLEQLKHLEEVISEEKTKETEELRKAWEAQGINTGREILPSEPVQSSKEMLESLKARKKAIIEENKRLAKEKPEGWAEKAKQNASEVKEINTQLENVEGIVKQGDPKTAINKHLSVTEGTTSTGKPRYRSEFTKADVESGRITQEEYDNWLDNAKSRTSEVIFRSKFTKNAIKQGMEELGLPKGGTAEAEFIDNVMFKLQEKFLKEYDPSKQDDPFGWLFFTGGGRGVGAVYRAKGDVMNEYKKQVKTEQIDAIKDFENMYGEGAAGEATPSGPAEIAKERVMFTETVDFAESELQRIEDAVRDADVDVENLTYKDTKKLLNKQKLLPNGKIPTSSKNVVGEGPLLDVLTVVSEKFGIPVERVLANQDLSGKLRNSARDFISENARQLINSLPEGTTPSGKSTGIANTKLGEFYVKGERVKMSETGSKQGLEEQTRQDITKRDFLEMFGINADGTYTKGTKFDSAIRELVVQTASIISNQKARQVKNKMQAKIGEGRNEAMASEKVTRDIERELIEAKISESTYESIQFESFNRLKPAYAEFENISGRKVNDIAIEGNNSYTGVPKEVKATWVDYTSSKLRKTFPDGKISENMVDVMFHDLLHSGNRGSRNMLNDVIGGMPRGTVAEKLAVLNKAFDIKLEIDNTSTVGEGVYMPRLLSAKSNLVKTYRSLKRQGLTGDKFNEKFVEKVAEEFSPDGTIEGLEKAIEANRQFVIEDIMKDVEAMQESQDGLDMAMFDYKLRGSNQFGLWRLAGASLKTVNPEAFANYNESYLEHSVQSVENRGRVLQAIAKYNKNPQTLRKVLNALLASGRTDFITKVDLKELNHSQGTKGLYVDASKDLFTKDSMKSKQIRVTGKYRGKTEAEASLLESMESSEALEAAAKKAKSVPKNQRSAEALIVLDAVKSINELKKIEKLATKQPTVETEALASENIDKKLNDILEHSIGVKSAKEISGSEAGIKGAKSTKGLMGLIGGSRRRLFLPDSAADLDLLLEPLYGKGAVGIENKRWFQDNFYRKFEEGINKYNTARQNSITSYQKLRKDMPSVVKQLGKDVPGKSFTTDMALRVHIWEKAGFETPDLPEATKAEMLEHVRSNPELLAYAYRLSKLTGVKTGLKKPTSEWWAESIASEISDVARGVERSEFMADFIEARKVIFSEKNLNKMESRLGKEWRKSIEDMFDRMETGRLRSETMGPITNKVINYFNGSIGTIMNFNTRSAVLQLISSVNFINMSFNNPLRAAQAFANQKQYWKDFMTIMNSDMLKQRRNGLQINVTEAELAEAAGKSKNPAQAVLAKLIKAGYLPTKIADSFAIASGGATYYRNAVRKYMKEGMSKAEAEQKAFLDFQAIAERTQQSSRPDLISKQQTTLAGRLILPFANTPLQMNRIMMKEILDIKKGRFKGAAGFTEKMGKVGYYGFLQTTIFAALQSAAMAVFTNSDDDELKAKKQTQMLETVTDSFLRGMGIKGSILNGVINAVKEFKAQDEKGFSADFSEVAEDLLSISPPVGSKFRQLDAAGNTYKYNKKQIWQEKFDVDIDSPGLEAVTRASEAVFNVPVNRVQKKLTNLRNAMDADYETWQRVLMALGWSEWDVAPEEAKEKRDKKKQEAIDAADAVVEKENMKLQDEEKRQGKEVTCASVSRSGNRCKRKVLPGKRFCTVHEKVESREDGKETQCTHIKSNGDRCKMQTTNKSGKCYYHD